MNSKYSQEVIEFIKRNVVGTKTRDLIDLVNKKYGTDFTISKMQSFKKNYNLKSETKNGLPAGRATQLFPADVRKFISNNHKGIAIKDMTDILNSTFSKYYKVSLIQSYYSNNKIQCGVDAKFRKGNISWNKGLKGITTGGVATQFKKGSIPPNRAEIGYERVDVDGYTQVKVSDGNRNRNFKYKHALIWEQNNGPIPDGYVVIFSDRDKTNFDISNLVLVSRSELLVMNKNNLILEDSDLTKTGAILAKVIDKTNKLISQ
jgi:hypothetical protein